MIVGNREDKGLVKREQAGKRMETDGEEGRGTGELNSVLPIIYETWPAQTSL